MTDYSWRNLFVAKLPRCITDTDLYNIFQEFHPISAKVMLEVTTGKSKGFGFVFFDSESAGHEAYRILNKTPASLHKHNFNLCIFASKHDGAVAMEMSKVLYIRNIPITLSPKDVEYLLGTLGNLTYCAMREDHHGSPVWVVYAEYATVGDAKKVLDKLHGNKTLFGNTVAVLAKFADTEETKRDRRLRHQQASRSYAARNSTLNNYRNYTPPTDSINACNDAGEPSSVREAPDTYRTHTFNNAPLLCNYAANNANYCPPRDQSMPYQGMNAPCYSNVTKFPVMNYADQSNNMASRNFFPVNNNSQHNSNNDDSINNNHMGNENTFNAFAGANGCNTSPHGYNANYECKNCNYMNSQMNMHPVSNASMSQCLHYQNSQMTYETTLPPIHTAAMRAMEVHDINTSMQCTYNNGQGYDEAKTSMYDGICENNKNKCCCCKANNSSYYANVNSYNNNVDDNKNNNSSSLDDGCTRYDDHTNIKMPEHPSASSNDEQACSSEPLSSTSSRKHKGKGLVYRHNPYSLSPLNLHLTSDFDSNIFTPSRNSGVTPNVHLRNNIKEAR